MARSALIDLPNPEYVDDDVVSLRLVEPDQPAAYANAPAYANALATPAPSDDMPWWDRLPDWVFYTALVIGLGFELTVLSAVSGALRVPLPRLETVSAWADILALPVAVASLAVAIATFLVALREQRDR